MSQRREFKLLGPDNRVIGTFNGKNPYQAAMKAASRGHDSIMLCEHYGGSRYSDKVHLYQGEIKELDESEMTPFALKHGISFKPDVMKIGTLQRQKLSKKSDALLDSTPEEDALDNKCYSVPMDRPQDCLSPCEIGSNGHCFNPG